MILTQSKKSYCQPLTPHSMSTTSWHTTCVCGEVWSSHHLFFFTSGGKKHCVWESVIIQPDHLIYYFRGVHHLCVGECDSYSKILFCGLCILCISFKCYKNKTWVLQQGMSTLTYSVPCLWFLRILHEMNIVNDFWLYIYRKKSLYTIMVICVFKLNPIIISHFSLIKKK